MEEAAIFMVMRQDARTAKDYVCMSCFEAVQEYWGDAGLVEACRCRSGRRLWTTHGWRMRDEGGWLRVEG
jgi:hypothetical protein